jgi:hypothetical protein
MSVGDALAEAVRFAPYGLPTDEFVRRLVPKITASDLDACWQWTGATSTTGYPQMRFAANGRARTHFTHRLVYLAVHGSLGRSMSVCHTCDNPLCVNPGHLFLGTHGQNMRDMARKGRANGWFKTHPRRGERNRGAKLNAHQVIEIRRLFEVGACRRDLRVRFGVGKTAIDNILAGRTWAHVSAEGGEK